MNTTIYNIKTINKNRWNKVSIEKSNVCQTYEWALACRSVFNEPLFIVAEDNGNWVGAWLVFNNSVKILPSFFTKEINILSEPLIIDEAQSEIIVEAFWEAIERMRPISVAWLNYANSRWKGSQFLKDKKFNEVIEYGSHILDLCKSEEVLWESIHGKHRNVIRKAEKEGIIVEETDDIESYYCLSEETYRRSEANGPAYKTLRKVYNYLNPAGMCKVFFARQGDKLAAGAYMLLCGGRVTYWHGASCNNPPTGAANLLHWEMIRGFKNEGYRWYDFGGAALNVDEKNKERSITRFKERFGGDLEIFFGGSKIYSPLRKGFQDKAIRPVLMLSKYF